MGVTFRAGMLGLAALLAAQSAPLAAQTSSNWSTHEFAPMLEPRSESSVADLDGRMYVIGGYPGDRIPSNVVQVWDSRTDSWSYGPPLPMPLHHTVAAVANGKLYLIGGEYRGAGTGQQEVYVDTVFELDVAGNAWRPRAPMPTGRSGMGAAVIGDKIYVAGGRPPAGHDFAVYDATRDSWEVLPDLPTQRNHVAMGAIDGKVFVAGGRFGAGFQSELTAILEIYDPATNTWTAGTPLPEIRSGITSIVVNGCLFAIGGEWNRAAENGLFANNEAYNPRSDTWHVLEPMTVPTHGQVGAALFGERIHIPGGALTQGVSRVTTANQAYRVTLSCR